MKLRKRHKAHLRVAGDLALLEMCVDVLPGESINHITRDMMEILTTSKRGVGLSANQAGYAKRIIIIKAPGGYETLVNPIIISRSREKCTQTESCLSYPGRSVPVSRSYCVEVLAMRWSEVRDYKGFESRIIQHEIDHLNGICKVAKGA